MNNFILKFVITSFVLLCISLLIHQMLIEKLEENLFTSSLVISYITNYLLAVIIFLVIDKIRLKQTAIIGYIFLFGSLLKFLVYFTLIYPLLTAEGSLTKQKFFFFFIPYAICLIVEAVFLTKLLNMNEKNN